MENLITQNIKDFVSPSQIATISHGLKGEEKDYFKDILISLDKTIESMPKVYETDNIKLRDKIAHLHYFSSGSDWYIVEKDSEPEQLQAFGYVILNGDMQNAELGYISIEELKKIKGVELDLHFTPKKLSDILDKKNPEAKEEIKASELPEKPTTARKEDLKELFDKQLELYEKSGKNKHLLNQISNELGIYWENVVSRNPEEFTGFLELQKNLPAKIKVMGSWASDAEYNEDFKNNLKTNLWELIPEQFKAHKMPKRINYRPDHEDKGLLEIIKPFIGQDDLRPVMKGVDFNKHGIVVTDANKLLFLSHPDEAREEKNYCITNDCLKQNENKPLIDGKYPQWERVIPDNRQLVSIHAESLISYIETVIAIKYFNITVRQILVTFGGGDNSAFDITEMGFNADFLLEGAKAMYKLGYDQIDIGYSHPSRAITMCKKGELKNVHKLQTDFALVMPIMIGQYIDLDQGTMYFNMESECVSTKGIDDKSCLNPIVIREKKIEKQLKKINDFEAKQSAKETKLEVAKITADSLMAIDSAVSDKLNIQSGSQLYADEELQKQYKKSLDDEIIGKFIFPLDKEVQDIIEDDNYHSLNQYLMLSGAFGEKEKTEWIAFLNKKSRSVEGKTNSDSGNFLNLEAFFPEPMPEKLTKEVLATRLKILKKMEEKNPSSVLKTRIKLITKMLANPEKFCCGGEVSYKDGGDLLQVDDMVWNDIGNKFEVVKKDDKEYYFSVYGSTLLNPVPKETVHNYIKSGKWTLKPKHDNGGNIPENLVEELKPIFPAIEEFGITEIFIQDGEVRMTSNYDIPSDYAQKIEEYVLNTETNKGAEEDAYAEAQTALNDMVGVKPTTAKNEMRKDHGGAMSKSKEASKVLQLMDEDYSYQEALKKVLSEDKGLKKETLEKELEIYI